MLLVQGIIIRVFFINYLLKLFFFSGLVLADATAQKTTSEFIEKIDGYAVERWESVMKYIVNPRDSKVSNSTKEILKFSGLMKP